MATVSKKCIVLMYIFTVATSHVSSSSSLCSPQSNTFIHDLKFQCPQSISFTLPIQMDGESLEKDLRYSPMKVNTAVLFYASWCPFSSEAQSRFGALSSMFPQIKHVMVEESSALPSIFSRYGIHSLPSILMVNQTGRARHHGPKDLHSLVRFYKRTTGLHPVLDETKVPISDAKIGHRIVQPWNPRSFKEIFTREPYLVLSVLFLLLKGLIYVFPEIVSHLKALWVAYAPPLTLGVLGDSRQLLDRVLHVVDVKRICNKLNLWKSRNFHDGPQRARVWPYLFSSH